MFAEVQIDIHTLYKWIGPAAGIGATLLVLLLGWLIVGRRRAGRAASTNQSAGAAAAPDPFVQGAATERRGALRRGGNPVAILVSDAEARSDPTNGWVVDRSTGGLCLQVTEEYEAGTIISVRTTNAPQSIPWVQVEVKNCRAVGKEYELGCQFVRTPPWSVMLLFG